MEILNVGPLELVFILLIALIVLGPEEMVKTGRSIAKGMRKFIRSPIWKALVDTSQEIRDIPRKFIREAGLEESMEEINRINRINRYPEEGKYIKPPGEADVHESVEAPSPLDRFPEEDKRIKPPAEPEVRESAEKMPDQEISNTEDKKAE